jgi:response regulator RpfG family c-di-GMP phosphodiesterase
MEIVLIDDDNISLFLSTEIMKDASPDLVIHTFQRANDALHFLASNDGDYTVLLDLNMPELSGWDFLNACERFNLRPNVYILSSSVNPEDQQRSTTFEFVQGFLSKPLNPDWLVK